MINQHIDTDVVKVATVDSSLLSPLARLGGHEDCYAFAVGNMVVVGNSVIERRWRYSPVAPVTLSIRNKLDGTEWVGPEMADTLNEPDTNLPHLKFDVAAGRATAVSAGSLTVTVSVALGSSKFVHELQIFPNFPAVIQRGVRSEDIEVDTDSFALRSPNVRLKQVTFVDSTDQHNELVREETYRLHQSEAQLPLHGNLFAFENILDPSGLAFLKLAPLPSGRPLKSEFDLTVASGRHVQVSGLASAQPGEWGYRCSSIVYDGTAAGLTIVLQKLQRLLRRRESGRDGLFLSNTWGDRGRDGRLSEQFLRDEIEIAQSIGVDVVQIDDGWQAGRSANSVVSGGIWEGFQNDHSFWLPHAERFPRGLKPIVEAAAASGLSIGLWFAPDSADNFANWRRDADTLIGLHRSLNINHFKLDGIKLRSSIGEQRLQQLLTAIREESSGRIACDLDVTAETRPGYFGALESGAVFVENRYTDTGNYFPHATLRNTWNLCRFIDPVRLRMELLNNERNVSKYGDDPLAPVHYDPSYLFAMTMISSPLGWFELSGLSHHFRRRITPLVQLWRDHRDRLQSGPVVPVGEEPDGSAWTGFFSTPAGGARYLIAFRELNDRPCKRFELPGVTEHSKASILYGTGSAVPFNGAIDIHLKDSLSFIWVKIETS